MNNFKFLFPIFLICAPHLNAKPIKNQDQKLKIVLLKIQKAYDKTTRFQANFKQKYHHKILKKIDESEGKIYFQKPGMLRWDYQSPYVKSFVITNNSLWVHQPEDNLVHVNKCFKQDGLTASISFLWGQGKISEQFLTTWFEGQLGDKQDHHIALIPMQKNGIYKQLILVVDNKTYRVKQSIVIDLGGNMNQFIFSDAHFNQKILAALFKTEFPKGTKIMPIPGSCTK
jgi:outer membrane lipoprotein carrier protein